MDNGINRRSTFLQALADFAAKTDELTRVAVDKRAYVLVSALRAYLRELVQWEGRYVSRTHLLNNAAYFGKKDFLSIDSSQIADDGSDRCLDVFSILLTLGLGHRLHEFTKKDIVDSRLPEDLASLKRKLKGLADGEDLATRFNERQWKFCPVQFSYLMDKDFFEDRVIPVCRKELLNSGGTANVFQISVQEEFVDPKLRALLAEDNYAKYDDKQYGCCYIFALKTFEHNFHHYHDEIRAFDGLRENRGVIRRLGNYSYRVHQASDAQSDDQLISPKQQSQWKDTMNILLEYGTFDLRLIFGHNLPPVFPAEIAAFWKALFQVGDALYGIHDFKAGGSEYNGWHADIKPENIIFVRGKYKLADPGFARFKKKLQDTGAAPPEIRIHGGTDTYGAPEGRNGTTVHQTIDIWSLGCVFSMAATWIVLGYQGIVQYASVREKALEKLLKGIKDSKHPLLASRNLSVESKPEKLDCFHDGCQVLPEVKSWHELLRRSMRKQDPLTEHVLDLVDQKMLIEDPQNRIKSKELCTDLRQLVKSANKVVRDWAAADPEEARQRREVLESLLSSIDREAVMQAPEPIPAEPSHVFEPGLPVDRHALKVQLQNVAAKKTSHRFETIPEPRSNTMNTDVDKPTIVASDTLGTHDIIDRIRTRVTSQSGLNKRQSVRQSTIGPVSRIGTAATAMTFAMPTHASQNVIQAHERMQREAKAQMFGLRKPRRQKDEYLSKHFKKRDVKFLIDDAETMADFWDEATFVVETLVMKAYGQDPDGMDMSFANDTMTISGKEDASIFRKAMQKARPKTGSHVHTNMKTALTDIFNEYIFKLRSSDKSKVNSLTIIVLTDGLWTGMKNQEDMDNKIIEFDKSLAKEMDGMRGDRQVSIQFIQFGDNDDARERLRRLDDDMPFKGVEDMIDFESFSIQGNVFKMLLGSFVEEIDALNDSAEDLTLQEDQDGGFVSASWSTLLQPLPEEGSDQQRPVSPAPAASSSKGKKSRLSRFMNSL